MLLRLGLVLSGLLIVPTSQGADLPTEDLALKFRVYAFGLPTWFDATVEVNFDGPNVRMRSDLETWIVSNRHRSDLVFSQCSYRPSGYTNRGFSPGWRFDDSLAYDWEAGVARYQGELKRPNQDQPVHQALEHPLQAPEIAGYFVDKLSQFFVMGCYFDDPANTSPLLLNYLDDTVGRYRVRVVQRGEKIRVDGRAYATIQVESEPFEATPGSIHRRVNYWLVPELGYLPALIKTKLRRLPLTVKLTDVDLNLDESAPGSLQ